MRRSLEGYFSLVGRLCQLQSVLSLLVAHRLTHGTRPNSRYARKAVQEPGTTILSIVCRACAVRRAHIVFSFVVYFLC
jgi:hypothetical protein